MSLKDRLIEDMKQAMRDKAQERLESIRMLRAAIQRREVDERVSLDDTQVVAVIEKLVKQSRDAVEQFQKGARPDLVTKESAHIAILESYLPARLSEQEVDALVAAAIAESGAVSAKDMGKVMGILKPKLQGRADMGAVSGKIKAKLSAAG